MHKHVGKYSFFTLLFDAVWYSVAMSMNLREFLKACRRKKAIELATIEKTQSEVNKNNADAAATLLKSVESVPEFASRIGSLLVLKTVREGKQIASVIVLTTKQLALVENQPELMNFPATLLDSLNPALLK